MKFYCLLASLEKKHNEKSMLYLQEACESRGLEFVVIEADTFDYSQDLDAVLEAPSILYRLGVGKRAGGLEPLLTKDGVATLYTNRDVVFMRSFPWGAATRLWQAGLPIIPTIFNLSSFQDDHLAAYAEKLGGYPIILKASGGSHGASVLRLDSLESLRSVMGYVTSDPEANFVMRKYIEDATHVRMVIVGDKVVDAIRYLPQPNDFRTNAVTTPTVEAFAKDERTAHLFDLSVQATKALGLEFGGVDLLLSKDRTAYIAEVNFPCNFARNQENTGTDVAGAIVDYLVTKTKG